MGRRGRCALRSRLRRSGLQCGEDRLTFGARGTHYYTGGHGLGFCEVGLGDLAIGLRRIVIGLRGLTFSLRHIAAGLRYRRGGPGGGNKNGLWQLGASEEEATADQKGYEHDHPAV